MRNWKIRDFVLIGLLAAVEAAVIYGVGMLTAVLAPIMHIFGPSITAFIMGTVALFIVKRVRRFGAMTLFQSLGVALFTLTGMGSVVCLICVVIVSLIADILITKTNFKTISVAVGHGLAHAAYFFGGCFPMLFFLERDLFVGAGYFELFVDDPCEPWGYFGPLLDRQQAREFPPDSRFPPRP